MKILAFVDLHADLTALKKLGQLAEKEMPDLILNLGDFTVFEQNIDALGKRLSKLHKKQIVLQGNHEEVSTTDLMCKRYGWNYAHKKIIEKNGVMFIGFGGGGFTSISPKFDGWIKKQEEKIRKAKKVVLMTHQPPRGTKLDRLYGEYTGNKSFADFIKKHSNVILAVSGHIHETAGKQDKVNNAKLYNPGPTGKVFTI